MTRRGWCSRPSSISSARKKSTPVLSAFANSSCSFFVSQPFCSWWGRALARSFAGRRVHDPTATVLIVDNSMSSGLIRGGARVVDLLQAVALRSIDRASDQDRVWLIRAGEPWGPAITGSRADLRAAYWRQTPRTPEEIFGRRWSGPWSWPREPGFPLPRFI